MHEGSDWNQGPHPGDTRSPKALSSPHSSHPWAFGAGVPLSSPRADPGAERGMSSSSVLLKGALCTPGPPAPSTTRHRRHRHRRCPPCWHLTACTPKCPLPIRPLSQPSSFIPGGAQPPTVPKIPPKKPENCLSRRSTYSVSAAELSPRLWPASWCRRARSLHGEGIFLQEKYFSPGAGRPIQRKSWK